MSAAAALLAAHVIALTASRPVGHALTGLLAAPAGGSSGSAAWPRLLLEESGSGLSAGLTAAYIVISVILVVISGLMVSSTADACCGCLLLKVDRGRISLVAAPACPPKGYGVRGCCDALTHPLRRPAWCWGCCRWTSELGAAANAARAPWRGRLLLQACARASAAAQMARAPAPAGLRRCGAGSRDEAHKQCKHACLGLCRVDLEVAKRAGDERQRWLVERVEPVRLGRAGLAAAGSLPAGSSSGSFRRPPPLLLVLLLLRAWSGLVSSGQVGLTPIAQSSAA